MEPPHHPSAVSNNLRNHIQPAKDHNITIQMQANPRSITERISNVFAKSNRPITESESNSKAEDEKLKYRSFDHGKVNTVLSEYLFKENVRPATKHEVEEAIDLKNLTNLKAQLSTSSNTNAIEDEIYKLKAKTRDRKRAYLSTLSTKFNPDILVGSGKASFIRGNEYFSK
jgi:hypothetical protein